MPLQPAAFFDMDNTLLNVGTGMSWVRFLRRRGEITNRLVAKAVYWSALYKLAVLDMEDVFTKMTADLEGDSEQEMLDKAEVWYRDHLVQEVALAGRVAIEAHRAAGHHVVLATGSTQYAARPVARGVGIEHVLSSVLEAKDGTFTGKASALCFGTHKVRLVEAWANANGVDLGRSWFYSDSFNDLPLLERVGIPIAVNPDTRLLRHARRRGWPVRYWV
jgi:HAD superfamily hydrolase (TIGR01490 family)